MKDKYPTKLFFARKLFYNTYYILKKYVHKIYSFIFLIFLIFIVILDLLIGLQCKNVIDTNHYKNYNS